MDFVLLKTHGNTLWLHNNRYKYNETEIMYFETLLPERTYTINTTAADFSVTNLYAGSWCFQIKKSGATRQTFPVSIQTDHEYVVKLREDLQVTDKEYDKTYLTLRDEFINAESIPNIQTTYTHMTDIEALASTNRRETIHKALLYTLDLLQFRNNQAADQIEAYNQITFDNDKFIPSLNGIFAGYIKIEKLNDFWEVIRREYLSLLHEQYNLSDLQEGLYRITLLSSDQDIYKIYYLYRHDPEDLQKYYYEYIQAAQEENDQINQYIEDSINAPELSDDEKILFAKQILYSPQNIILPAPIISENIFGTITMQIRYDLIQNYPGNLYIVAEEQDTLNITDNSIVKRRFLITAETMKVARKDYYFNLEPYFWYIENEKGIKISPLAMYDLSDTDSDYETRAVHQLLVNRTQRLAVQLKYDLVSPQEAILAADEVTYDTDVTLFNFADEIFLRYIEQPHSQDRWEVLKSLYTDIAFHESFQDSLSVIIRPQWHLLEFPQLDTQSYVVRAIKWTYDGITQELYGSSNTSTSVYYTDCLYSMFAVYDSNTGKRLGGWLAFDNTQGKLKYDMYNMGVTIDLE